MSQILRSRNSSMNLGHLWNSRPQLSELPEAPTSSTRKAREHQSKAARLIETFFHPAWHDNSSITTARSPSTTTQDHLPLLHPTHDTTKLPVTSRHGLEHPPPSNRPRALDQLLPRIPARRLQPRGFLRPRPGRWLEPQLQHNRCATQRSPRRGDL